MNKRAIAIWYEKGISCRDIARIIGYGVTERMVKDLMDEMGITPKVVSNTYDHTIPNELMQDTPVPLLELVEVGDE